MGQSAFKASGYSWKLYSGAEVIERDLPASVDRVGAERAMVICSPSVNGRTNTSQRIQATLGARCVGVFDEIGKDSTYESVRAATEAARRARADLLIAVGGGSVIVAVRAVAIFMAEVGDPFEIMTQYPQGKPAFSPRLMAPKPPIINIPTTPTSAMNRAGTGLKNPDLDHRMEYFDPKTRPLAIFLDDEALLSAPPELVRSTATTVFASLVGTISQTDANPLVDGDRHQAFRLVREAYGRLMDELDNPALRQDLCIAAFLQNRAEDDDARRFRGGPFSGNYAISTALHLCHPRVGQGESTSAVHTTVARLSENIEAPVARRVAVGLGVWRAGMSVGEATVAVADSLDAIYAKVGMPTRVGQLGIPREDLVNIARKTVKNFNANSGARSEDEQIGHALHILEAAW